MSFIDVMIGKLAPHNCLGCDTEGSLLCSPCQSSLPPAADCCFNCQRYSPGGLTCSACSADSDLRLVRSAVSYQGTAKQLVWKLKFAGAQQAAQAMATCMLPLLPVNCGERILVVSVPTATTRVRQRGYNQARLLARQLALQAGLPWIDCLARDGQAHQVGAGREQRLSQLQTAFRVTQQRFVRSAHIILVDDVVTTGATLQATASALMVAGAARVDGLTFARSTMK